MRRLAGLLALLALGAGAARALPASSIELSGSGGPDTGGLGASASVDLDPDGLWTLSGSYSYTLVTQTSAPSEENAGSLQLSKGDGGSWVGKAGVDYSQDRVNNILYAGPAFGLSYTAYDAAPGADADDGDDQGDSEDATREAWSLSVDATVHGYHVGLGALSNSAQTKSGVAFTLIEGDSTMNLTQFNPSLGLDVPLAGGVVTLGASYGHDFYDSDPALAASVINRRFKGVGASRASTLSQGLYYDSWAATASLKLPLGFGLDLSYGQSLLVSPAQWEQLLGAGLGAQPWPHWSVNVGYDGTVEGAELTPGYTASITEDF